VSFPKSRQLLVVAAILLGSLAASASAAAVPTTVSIYRDIAGISNLATYRHPGSFRLTSEDSFVVFRHLRWRRWGLPTAKARGRARTCGSGGPEGYVCHSGRVRLVAGERADCGDGRIYLTLVAFGIPDYGPELEIPISAAHCPGS
jgi:hypothetical protein